MKECIFCIKENTSMEDIIFSDTDYYIMLDKFPSHPGHLLIITKQHFENFLETPDEIISIIMQAAKKVGIILKKICSADGMKVSINIGRAADQRIMHTHIHIIPEYTNSKIPPNFRSHLEITEEYISKIKPKLLKELSAQQSTMIK